MWCASELAVIAVTRGSVFDCRVEMCMGMGTTGIPWDSLWEWE